ncbi:MAG TPA: M14 family zinc carboxypeptidase [Phycisphaerae bacterium]|nr:M14 family zinc carboxypeptidase [Phycisphaerae bacterium]
MQVRLHVLATVLGIIWCCGVSLADSPPEAQGRAALADDAKGIIRVDVTLEQTVTGLKRVLRAWDVAGTVDPGRSLDLVVTELQRRQLEAAGIPFEIVPRDVGVTPAGLRATYHSFADMETELAAMATNYPAITDLYSIGTSWEGRTIWCLEITDNPGVDEGEPGVQYMGLHHAREWPCVEVTLDIAGRLTSQYASNPTIQNLVDNNRIWVIPCVNPDGLVYSRDVDEWWRQNRRDLGAGVYGVDLNRNYDGSASGHKDGAWGSIGTGSQSHQPGYETYVGPWPLSEPETQAIRDFFATRDVVISISYHTYSQLVLWPWGFDGSVQTDDDALFVSIGQGMASAIGGYTAQQASALYPTTGGSDDWAYGYRYYELGKNTLGYTVEMGTSFHPAESLLQALLDKNWDGALYVLQQAAAAQSQLVPFVLPPILTTPPVDADGDYTVSWVQKNPDAGATLYELQELTGLSRQSDGAELGAGNWNLDGFSTSNTRAHLGFSSFKSPPGNEIIAAMTTTDPLPVEAGDQLTFWTWYNIETDWDMAIVEVSADGRQFDVLDKFTGSSGNWVQQSYSLDAYAGRSIYLRFRYTTDTNTTGEGFYVDDIHPVARWSDITTLSSSIAGTSYPITGRSDDDYFYRVRGSSPARGFGEFCDLGMTRVYANLADADGDGDHDLEDFADFQLCFGGDGQAIPGTCPAPTAVFDFDLDQDVDLADLDVFDACFTGPDGAVPPECPF